MKIFSTPQLQDWDRYTIQHEGISSLALMELASATFVHWFTEHFPDQSIPIYIFCGSGNNGGDGLVIGRLLHQKSYSVEAVFLTPATKRTPENQTNLEAAQNLSNLNISTLSDRSNFPAIPKDSIVIDALIGIGLQNEIRGFTKDLIDFLNRQDVNRIAVDVPSGLQGDRPSIGTVLNAEYTFSFEQPSLAFLFPENHKYVGQWTSRSIHLSEEFSSVHGTENYLLTHEIALSYYKQRDKFGHKGNFGHSLLMMGSQGKIGAAVLSTFACLRSGCGLTTVYVPGCGYDILQSTVPEAMVKLDSNKSHLTELPPLDDFTTIGIGCGLGMESDTQRVLSLLLQKTKNPIVLDADALNIIASSPEMLENIPKDSILTPHPKEFERLFGKTENDFARNKLQREKARSLNCFILLKGAHSCIATPEGKCYFNSTGNPGMATAGSGDVLTGIITGLMAQGYASEVAICLGVYLHGLAGDICAQHLGQDSLIARDIIDHLPYAFLQLNKDLRK